MAAMVGLSGCKTNSAESAWQLMQQQQQEQALARQKEDEAEGRRRPKAVSYTHLRAHET